jgi:uncharacterized protein
MTSFLTPGVYKQDILPEIPLELQTGIPVFVGLGQVVEKEPQPLTSWGRKLFDDRKEPQPLTSWDRQLFDYRLGKLPETSYLADAVKGFFENDGKCCYVLLLKDNSLEALEAGLETIESLDEIDLICLPDLMSLDLNLEDVQIAQLKVLEHCYRLGDRFAILDALPESDLAQIQAQRQELSRSEVGAYGALYYPWIRLANGLTEKNRLMPPCGHIAGIYARSDRKIGIHKAPANEVLKGVLGLEVNLSDKEQGQLNPLGINALRIFPGRGIRVWGARTLSANPAWTYINVKRLFITLHRWIDLNLADVVFEPNNQKLWASISRELTDYLTGLFQKGAFLGNSPEEAFYVKCDAETNPGDRRENGQVTTEIGLRPTIPGEFIVVRIVQSPNTATIITTENNGG